MSKIRKVIYIMLGGAFGGIIGTLLFNISVFLQTVIFPGIILGTAIGLGISIGDVLTLDKNIFIKVLVQTAITGFIFISFIFIFFLIRIPVNTQNSYIFGPFFGLTLVEIIMALGISIAKESVKKVKSFYLQVILGTIISTFIVAILYFYFTKSTELLKTYTPITGVIGFDIILISSIIDKKNKWRR